MKKLNLILLTTVSMLSMQFANAQLAIPTCPIKFGNVEFTSSSPFGDKICPALSSLKTAANGLGSDVSKKIEEVKRDMEQFSKVTLDGVINEEAVERYNASVKSVENIKDALINFVKDKECGVPGAMKALETSFIRFKDDIKTVGEISGKFVDALGKLKPVLTEALNVAEQVKQIANSINSQTPAVKQHYEVIKKAVDGIIADVTALSKLDANKLLTTGKDLVTGLVPYVGSCAACATSLGVAIAGIGETAGGVGGGTAASETGVGALIGAIVAAVGTVQTTVSSALSSAPCGYVFAEADKVVDYINDLKNFIEAVSTLASSIGEHSQKVIEASQALVELGKALGTENAPRVEAIKKSFITIANNITDAVQVIEDEVAPKASKFLGNKIQQLSSDVIQLQTCYIKMQDALGFMGSEVKDAASNFGPAVLQMVDANKLVDNVKEQLSKAKDAAVSEMQKKWTAVDKSRDAFIRTLLGSKPTDLGAVIQHLPSLVMKIDDVVKDGKDLAGDVGNLVLSAMDAGKRGFLNQINTSGNSAKAKFDNVSKAAKEMLKEIAIEKAKSSARAKNRQVTLNNFATKTGSKKQVNTIASVQKFKGLKLQVSTLVVAK
jgi:hypothetical protein